MVEPWKHARNVAVIFALAAAVAFFPEAERAGNVIGWAATLVMYAALAWFAYTLYRSYRTEIYSLGDNWRALLYGSVAVLCVALVATRKLWDSGGGTLVWFAMLFGAGYGMFAVWQRHREYGI